MTTTLADELAQRRAVVNDTPDLRHLAERLRRLAAPLLEGDLYLPNQKALLSRDGGVCPTDGARLEFDPRSPEAHRCPACHTVHRAERHHRAWIWRYHLWLSERAIHLALLSGLLDEPPLASRAAHIVERYAQLYPTVPNKDNVLGPTRLFFSTYLESIWLTQILIAALLLEARSAPSAQRPAPDRFRRVLEPAVRESANLIASFNEGLSNRQVWNATAQLAAGLWLTDDALYEAGWGGLDALLQQGVTSSGLWHEGENYHFFALRGFALGGELARWAGRAVPSLRPMYEAPLDTLLPDLTLPARGDAPYGVSVAQPRFADLWELGCARATSDRIESLLAELYALDLPEGDDPGLQDVSEQEVNRPPTRLTRERLSWKALMWMRSDGPRAGADWRASSRALEDAGVVVLRPARDAYVSVECAGPRTGHGHPDALHLSVFLGCPVLADFGTGSYVTPSLHWYRSALAHNTPLMAAGRQHDGVVWCSALDGRDGWSWCQCVAEDVCGKGTVVRRSIVCCADWALDVVDVTAPEESTVDLAVHPLDAARLALAPRERETVLARDAPGPPTLWFADGAPLGFVVRRASGSGRWVQAAFRTDGGRVALDGDEIVIRSETEVRLVVGAGAARIEAPGAEPLWLFGARRRPEPLPSFSRHSRSPVLHADLLPSLPSVDEAADAIPKEAWTQLRGESYRRSEEPYGSRGPFRAELACFAAGDRLGFAVWVVKPDVTFRVTDSRLDNEAPDIHADGVQFYVGGETWRGWVVVPRTDGGVSVRAVAGTAAHTHEARATWKRTPDGYALMVEIAMPRALTPGDRVPMNVVVNEMYPDRERRAGQLALDGGGWVYLRGDREPPGSGAVLEIS